MYSYLLSISGALLCKTVTSWAVREKMSKIKYNEAYEFTQRESEFDQQVKDMQAYRNGA